LSETSFLIERAGRQPIYGDLETPDPGGKLDRQSYPVFVFSHGFLGHKDWGFFPYLAKKTVEAGNAALRFSFSKSGVTPPSRIINRPDLFRENTIKNELEDYAVLFDALGSGELPLSERLDIGRCALIGFSRGGATAILHASDHVYENKSARVKAICTIGAMSDWFAFDSNLVDFWDDNREMHIDYRGKGDLVLGPSALDDYEMFSSTYHLLRAAGKITIPWLIVHAAVDSMVPLENAHNLFQQSDQRLSTLSIIDDADHSMNWKGDSSDPSPAIQKVCDTLIGFFASRL